MKLAFPHRAGTLEKLWVDYHEGEELIPAWATGPVIEPIKAVDISASRDCGQGRQQLNQVALDHLRVDGMGVLCAIKRRRCRFFIGPCLWCIMKSLRQQAF